mgnify:CR=1 FL=1
MSLKSTLIGQKVIARSRNAGVHIGTLDAKDGQEVRLTDAKRLWYWKGAFTLSQVAETGVKKGSKVGCPVPVVELSEVCEVLPITDTAFSSLEHYIERA